MLGLSIFDAQAQAFRFHPGPIFHSVVLADEINRAPPKTQSALLEAMEERQVSLDGLTRPLPDPFFVIATQNPVEQVGAYPLPESQLDRFMMAIDLGYPDPAAERELLAGGDRRAQIPSLPALADPATLLVWQREAAAAHVAPALLDYVQALLAATRGRRRGDAGARRGLSPRAGLLLVAAARAWALIAGRPMVLPEDVQAVFPSVAGHRLAGGARAGSRAGRGAAARGPAALTPAGVVGPSPSPRGAGGRLPTMPAATALDRAPATVPGAPGTGWLTRFRRRFFHVDPTDTDPVVLRHRRIYILPTPRGLAFIGTVATMLVTSLNYALSLGFAVTFLLAGLIAAALLQTYRNLAGMAFAPLVAGEAYAGGAVPFTLTVAGNGAPRFGDHGRRRRRRAGRRRPRRRRCAAADDRRAGAAPRPAAARPPDDLVPRTRWASGAAGRTSTFRCAGIVYPAPELDAPPLPPGAAGEGAGAAARDEDADLAGLRAYQAGDPMQRIAWKAVARGAGWHTKEFEGSGGGGTLMLAWQRAAGRARRRRRGCRASTAWVLAAERARAAVRAAVAGGRAAEGKGREHRHAALRALALCPGDAG